MNQPPMPPPPDDAPDDGGGRPTQAEVLVNLARDRFTLHQSQDRTPFALPVGGPVVARMFRGGQAGLRQQLAAAYLDRHGKPPSASALADALAALEGLALQSEPVDLALRVARRHDRAVALDLGHEDGTTAVVTPAGWSLTDAPAVTWRRTALTSAMPTPTRAGGDLDTLAELVNVNPDDMPLLIAWCVAALVPDLPHPIALFTGEQGSGKSVAARTLANLLDPSPAPLRTAPRDVESWAVAASGSWVVGLDNVSALRAWLSDALCRAATGDGMVRRQLYTDAGVSVLAFRRVVMLTSIDAGALRGDLAERLVVFELERLGAGRAAEGDLDVRERALAPQLLGSLLDLLSDVLAVLPSVKLDRLPRMADFARVVAAVDQVRGTDALERYLGQSERIAQDVVDADPLAAAVLDLLEAGPFEGSATELLDRLAADLPGDRRPKWFPGSASALAGQVRRAAPALREVGVDVEYVRTGSARTWSLKERVRDVPSSPSSPSSGDANDANDAHDGSLRTPSLSVAAVVGPAGTEQGHGGPSSPSQRHCTSCGTRPPIPQPAHARHEGLCAQCAGAAEAAS